MILSDSDLVSLTGRQRKSAQRRELDALGIPYKTRRDGSIVVFVEDCHAKTDSRHASAQVLLGVDPVARTVGD